MLPNMWPVPFLPLELTLQLCVHIIVEPGLQTTWTRSADRPVDATYCCFASGVYMQQAHIAFE